MLLNRCDGGGGRDLPRRPLPCFFWIAMMEQGASRVHRYTIAGRPLHEPEGPLQEAQQYGGTSKGGHVMPRNAIAGEAALVSLASTFFNAMILAAIIRWASVRVQLLEQWCTLHRRAVFCAWCEASNSSALRIH